MTPAALTPVVLIHGLYDTARIFDPMRAFLEARGRRVTTPDLKPNNGNAPLEELAAQVAGAVRGEVDLVGFSMGGLVARWYVQRQGGLKHVRRLITIASPHRGTWTAYAKGNAGARQMRPGSAFLRDPDSDRSVLNQVRFTSIRTPFDLMILPPSSSVVPEARNILVNVAAHPLMVRDRRVMEIVAEAAGA